MNEKEKIIKSNFLIDNKSAKLPSRPKPISSNSSTIFRASSKGENKDFLGETSSPYSLNLFNFNEDENTISAKLKLDLGQIQEEINKLDIDGKIRSAYGVEFK